MKYVPPGLPGSIVSVEPRYENFIGGKWLAPTPGKYRGDLAPATAGPITEVADSTPEDVELALDAAHAAKDAWGEASAAERAEVLNAIADAVEKNREMLAVAESWETAKPVRETLAADIPLVVDHFRYFAAAAAPRRDARLRSRKIWSPTTSGSRWAWWVRSSRSISRC
jgi:NAD-dependent aldehyde dehydrogenases